MDKELQRQIGQMLLAGFPGDQPVAQARRLVEDFQTGNFVLFAQHMRTAEGSAELCAALSQMAFDKTGLVPFIAADQEGGSVCRLVQGAALFPGAMAMAAAASPEEIFQMGQQCGRILRAAGVNVDLAPVLDVNMEPMNPVIGNRSYGDTPEQVARRGCAMMEGLARGGVLATVKHYPGHGCVRVDSHLGLPVNHKTLSELEDTEFLPFQRAFDRGAAAVMSCHIVFPELDPELPATLSPKIIDGLLRKRQGFSGLVFTDCLEMDAIRKGWGVGQGAVLAVEAGCDLLCISHHYEAVEEAAQSLYQAVESGRISRARIQQSYDRIVAAKKALGLLTPQTVTAAGARAAAEDPAAVALSRSLSRKSVTLLFDRGWEAVSRRKLLAMAPMSLASTQVQSAEQAGLSFARIAGEALGCDWAECPKNPTEEETAALLARADGYDGVVLGLYNARFRPGQQALLKALCGKKPVFAVLLGDPYDAALTDGAVAAAAAYEYTPLSAASAAAALAEGQFFGKLPIELSGR